MKNIGLGLVVFSLPSKFLWALGRGDGISALPPQGQAEARVGTPGFCSPFPPPRNLGLVFSISRCSKGETLDCELNETGEYLVRLK